jgi:hypothetical protein
MATSTAWVVILGLGGPDTQELVKQARPHLAPPASAITTRVVEASAVASAHPVHLRTAGYQIDTVCRDTYCVEELRAAGRVLIPAALALTALVREVSDPGHASEVDATEIVLPQRSAPGLLSIERVESDYTAGAAHARSWLRCETYSLASGRRLTLRDVVGARVAARIVAAAAARRDDGAPAVSATTTALLAPARGTVVLCGETDHMSAHDPITIEVAR